MANNKPKKPQDEISQERRSVIRMQLISFMRKLHNQREIEMRDLYSNFETTSLQTEGESKLKIVARCSSPNFTGHLTDKNDDICKEYYIWWQTKGLELSEKLIDGRYFKENNINKDQFDPITIKVAAKLTEAAVLTKLLEEKTPDYALFKLFASMQIGNQADVDRIIDVAVCENKPRYGIGDETAYNLSRDERNMRLSRQALKSLNAKKQAH